MESRMNEPGALGGTGRGDSSTTQAKEKAKDLGRGARDRALSSVDREKDHVSGLLDRVADSMRDDRIGGYASDYVRRGADWLRGTSSNDLLHSIQRGFRSRPGVVLAAAFASGLVLARVLKGATEDGGSPGDWERERAYRAGAYRETPYGETTYGETLRGGAGEGTWAGREEGTP